jgi:DNA helicase-2/ATP-dependent DNA helicase PcrA
MLDVHTDRAGSLPPRLPLDPAQQAVVDHGDGPLLVVAGAGSGKTLALASRAARLLAQGTSPERLLLITFSRRAAAELGRRSGRLLHEALGLGPGQSPPVLPWCGTFHGIAARVLLAQAGSLGLGADASVLDRGDAQDLLDWCRTRLGLQQGEQRFPLAGTCLAILSRCVNTCQPLAAVLERHYPWCRHAQAGLQRLFASYTEAKLDQHLLDYDDLLLYWHRLLQDPQAAHALAARFDHVLVDEVQDTNRLQGDILNALRPHGRGLTLVGDDAQAIYGFRGADVRQMLSFPASFDPPARVLRLERSFRSTQPLLEAANAVIAQATERFAKTLWSDRPSAARAQLVSVEDDAAQARWVADQVLRHREDGIRLQRQAVLFRTASHSTALELELSRRRIPFVKFGGLRFLEAAHVKDLLAVLRWAHNPRHRLAAYRTARLVPGIGAVAAQRLVDLSGDADDPGQALRAWAAPPRAAGHWRRLLDLLAAVRTGATGWPQDIDAALDWLRPLLPLRYEDATVRLGDLQQLAHLARGHGSRQAFLTDLALDPPEASGNEAGPPELDEDWLVLSTLHSAKGQEWTAVQILNVVDGCIPSDLATGHPDEIEEERRLLYVGMTRARDHLHLLVPQRFHVTAQPALGPRHLYAPRSRFIPESIEALFEPLRPAAPDPAPLVEPVLPGEGHARRPVEPVAQQAAPGRLETDGPVDLARWARGLWSG